MLSANAPRANRHKNWIQQVHLLAAPRSGGHYVLAWLQTGDLPVEYRHTDVWEMEDNSKHMLIKLYRRDIFQQCVSRGVGKLSGLYDGRDYLDKHGKLKSGLEEITVPLDLFGNEIWNTLGFHSEFQHISVRYREHHCIYYEDWCKNPAQELKNLGIKQRTKRVNVPVVTPMDWKNNVVNYSELKTFFDLAMIDALGKCRMDVNMDDITLKLVQDYHKMSLSPRQPSRKQRAKFDLRNYANLVSRPEPMYG